MRRINNRLAVTGALAGLAILVTGCGSTVASSAKESTHSSTITMADQPNTNFESILPILASADENVISANTIRLLYVPLYQFGSGKSATFDPSLSLAEAPIFSDGGLKVSIRLHHYRWSNGTPVTAQDAQFWEDLLVANKAQWSEYVPGEYPDFVTAFDVTGTYTFTMTFNKVYNQAFIIRNALAYLTPLPQDAWDRTSAQQPIGNDAATTTGAKAVFAYLLSKSKSLSTYTTDPLWKVIDGPYRLDSFTQTTGYTVLTRNPEFSGAPAKVARFEEVPFTSDTAEFDALRSGRLDYGYLPPEDSAQAGYFTSRGYKIDSWYTSQINFIDFNYANSTVGPIFKQLYVRQALEHLVDQPEFVKDIFHGYGNSSYGPVPDVPASSYVSSDETHPLYSYAPKTAAKLLSEHGWAKNSSGHLECTRAGASADECGSGIALHAPLTLTLLYNSGSVSATEEVEAFQSSLGSAGIPLSLNSVPFDSIFTRLLPGSNSWELGYWGGGSSAWTFLQDYPLGSQLFADSGSFNLGEYDSTTSTADISSALSSSGLGPLHIFENYVAQQVADLWMPVQPSQVSVVRSFIKGAVPQSSTSMVQPEQWTVSG